MTLAQSPKLIASRDLNKPISIATDLLRADFANPTQKPLTPPSANPYLLALYLCGEATI